MREKVGKSRNTVFFSNDCGSGGSKSRLAKAAGAEPARSGHFWKLRCPKSGRLCGAKQISKSKCTKHDMFTPLLEVTMSKKCTPLWSEAHFEVKMLKTPHVRVTFGRSDVVPRGRCKGLSILSKVNKTWGFLWHFQLQPPLHHTTLQYTTLQLLTTPSLHSTTLHSTTLHCTQLHSITLHYIALHYTPLHCTTLHYTTLHYLPLHFTTLHWMTLHHR